MSRPYDAVLLIAECLDEPGDQIAGPSGHADVHQPEQPGRKLRATLERGEPAMNRDEDLLPDILDVRLGDTEVSKAPEDVGSVVIEYLAQVGPRVGPGHTGPRAWKFSCGFIP
jgi:hypothetical protein